MTDVESLEVLGGLLANFSQVAREIHADVQRLCERARRESEAPRSQPREITSTIFDGQQGLAPNFDGLRLIIDPSDLRLVTN